MQDANDNDQVLSQAFSLLEQWGLFDKADEIQPLGNAAVYKSSVVLHLMLYQRLSSNHSLGSAVEHFFKNAPVDDTSNRRLREKTLSCKTGSYSAARKRLTVELVQWLQSNVCQSIIESTSASFKSQRVFMIDGTTLSASPTPALQKAFPPASNQHGDGVWPIIYLVTAHEMSSGVALPPAIGPMYGPNAVGETKLVEDLIKRLPPKSIAMADAAYGIYNVAFQASRHGHNFLLRLTSSRFESHLKNAKLVNETENARIYQLTWLPTKRELANNPGIPTDSHLEVQLCAIKIQDEWLYLITDLEASHQELRRLYFHRYDIEVDIRNIKVVLDAEHFHCKSVEMLEKELGMAMVAYNLTTQFRRQAADKAKRKPRELSFTGVWTVFRFHLLDLAFNSVQEIKSTLSMAINRASKHTLPRRPGRSYPREVYKRRPKSTHFQTRKRTLPPKETQGDE